MFKKYLDQYVRPVLERISNAFCILVHSLLVCDNRHIRRDRNHISSKKTYKSVHKSRNMSSGIHILGRYYTETQIYHLSMGFYNKSD